MLAHLLNQLLHLGNSLCLDGSHIGIMIRSQLPQLLLMPSSNLMDLPPQLLSLTFSLTDIVMAPHVL